MLAEAAAELGSNDAEIGHLDRIVLRDAPELVPAGQRGLCARPAGRNEELDCGVGEVLPDLLIRPVPPIEPVEGFTDRAIAHPVQLGLGLGRADNGDIREIPEHRLELFSILELEIRASCLHGRLVSVVFSMTFNKMGTLPLPLALHLATYTVIGLFCAFAGGLNLIDPTKIFPNAVIFLGLAGFSWGYVFGILMARKEVLGLGLVASIGYVVAGIWQLGPHWALGVLLLAIGAYGLAALALYRRQILEA